MGTTFNICWLLLKRPNNLHAFIAKYPVKKKKSNCLVPDVLEKDFWRWHFTQKWLFHSVFSSHSTAAQGNWRLLFVLVTWAMWSDVFETQVNIFFCDKPWAGDNANLWPCIFIKAARYLKLTLLKLQFFWSIGNTLVSQHCAARWHTSGQHFIDMLVSIGNGTLQMSRS